MLNKGIIRIDSPKFESGNLLNNTKVKIYQVV